MCKTNSFLLAQTRDLHRTEQNSDSSILSHASLIFNKTTIIFVDTLSKDSRISSYRYHWEHLYLSNVLPIFLHNNKNHQTSGTMFDAITKIITKTPAPIFEEGIQHVLKGLGGDLFEGPKENRWLVGWLTFKGPGWVGWLVGWLIMIRISIEYLMFTMESYQICTCQKCSCERIYSQTWFPQLQTNLVTQ